ncbi:MAG: DUF600 family protein [Bacillota bacterium]|nr:DUF600 family protein [Bacillota bacterium]
MDTRKIEEIYQKIADTVNDMIPDKWNKLYLYAEVSKDSGCVYFDFESATKQKFIYSLDIPEIYNIDENEFNKLERGLLNLFESLHTEFEKKTPQTWTNLTMYLDNFGKFKMDYSYDEVSFTPHEQRVIWKYKVLGIYPTNERSKKIVDDYIKNYENNHVE